MNDDLYARLVERHYSRPPQDRYTKPLELTWDEFAQVWCNQDRSYGEPAPFRAPTMADVPGSMVLGRRIAIVDEYGLCRRAGREG